MISAYPAVTAARFYLSLTSMLWRRHTLKVVVNQARHLFYERGLILIINSSASVATPKRRALPFGTWNEIERHDERMLETLI
jgi:hypothetical protein